jgi:hypothetical protein
MRFPVLVGFPDPTNALATGLLIAWGLSAATFTVGWRGRLAGTVLALTLSAVLLLDQQTYSNHLYLLLLLTILLALADPGPVWALRPTVPRWPVMLLMAQASIVYGFAALAKFTPTYLSGRALASFVPYDAGVALIGARATGLLILAASWGTIALELLLAWWLWVRPAPAVVLGVLMHVGMVTLMYHARLELTVFAFQMWALYPLFLWRARPPAGNPGSP